MFFALLAGVLIFSVVVIDLVGKENLRLLLLAY